MNSQNMRESSPRTPGAAITAKERHEGDVKAERAFRRTPRSVLLRWRRAAADERAKEVRPVRTHPPAAGIAGIARAEHRHRCARPADGGRQDQLERTMVRERVGRRERLVAESLTDDVDEAPFRSRRSAVRADGQSNASAIGTANACLMCSSWSQ